MLCSEHNLRNEKFINFLRNPHHEIARVKTSTDNVVQFHLKQVIEFSYVGVNKTAVTLRPIGIKSINFK